MIKFVAYLPPEKITSSILFCMNLIEPQSAWNVDWAVDRRTGGLDLNVLYSNGPQDAPKYAFRDVK